MDDQATFIIADNQDITRMGLEACLAALFSSSAATGAYNKRGLVDALTQAPDAVVVLDYTLFDFNGVEDLLVVMARFPQARWILFSSELSDDFIRKLCNQANVSIVLKDCPVSEIEDALQGAAQGGRFLCRQVKGLVDAGFAAPGAACDLTHTETEILKLIARGSTVKEMAAQRFCSVHTIITHKKNIFRKLGVNNVYEATKYALRAGLIEMMEYYI